MRILAPASLRFDVFTLDPLRGVLLRDGAEVPLRQQSFAVLHYLAENGGRAVSNDELVQAVWGSRPADPAASVWQCIKEVRRALGEDARWIVRTVYGRGYEFKAEIVRSGSTQPAPTESPETSANARRPARAPGARPATAAFAARAFRRWAAAAGGVACATLVALYLPGQFASPLAEQSAALVTSAALFSQNDERRVAELAASKELPLPPFQMHAPGHEVPTEARRFVGIWASDAGWSGSNRQYMLIITDADSNGVVSGYHVNGPPQPGSRFQSLAHFAAFKGSVSAASLSIEDAIGKFAASFLDQRRIQLDLTFRDGLLARVVLDPVWMLVDAEHVGARTD